MARLALGQATSRTRYAVDTLEVSMRKVADFAASRGTQASQRNLLP
jgi:hypothetical protein